MAKRMTADDILPLVASMTARERARLLKLMSLRSSSDAAVVYGAMPPGTDEFSANEEPLAWEAEGWEKFD
jgi:hypothetical protein